MKEIMVLLMVVFLIGGTIIGMFGLLWYRTAGLVHFFFDVDLNAGMGFKVAMTGFGMMLVGLGLLYLPH